MTTPPDLPKAAGCASEVTLDIDALGEAVATAVKDAFVECFGGDDGTLDVEIDPTKFVATEYCDADGNILTGVVCFQIDNDTGDILQTAEFIIGPDGVAAGAPGEGFTPCSTKPECVPMLFETRQDQVWVDNHSNPDRPVGAVVYPQFSHDYEATYASGTVYSFTVTATGSGQWGPLNDAIAAGFEAATGKTWFGPSTVAGDNNPRPFDSDAGTPGGAYAHTFCCPGDDVPVSVTAYRLNAKGNRVRTIPLAIGVIQGEAQKVVACVCCDGTITWTVDGEETTEPPACVYPCGQAPIAPVDPCVCFPECEINVLGPFCDYVDPDVIRSDVFAVVTTCGSDITIDYGIESDEGFDLYEPVGTIVDCDTLEPFGVEPICSIEDTLGHSVCPATGDALGEASARYDNSDETTDIDSGLGDVDADGSPDDTKWNFSLDQEPDAKAVYDFIGECLQIEGTTLDFEWTTLDNATGQQLAVPVADVAWSGTGPMQVLGGAEGSSGKILNLTVTHRLPVAEDDARCVQFTEDVWLNQQIEDVSGVCEVPADLEIDPDTGNVVLRSYASDYTGDHSFIGLGSAGISGGFGPPDDDWAITGQDGVDGPSVGVNTGSWALDTSGLPTDCDPVQVTLHVHAGAFDENDIPGGPIADVISDGNVWALEIGGAQIAPDSVTIGGISNYVPINGIESNPADVVAGSTDVEAIYTLTAAQIAAGVSVFHWVDNDANADNETAWHYGNPAVNSIELIAEYAPDSPCFVTEPVPVLNVGIKCAPTLDVNVLNETLQVEIVEAPPEPVCEVTYLAGCDDINGDGTDIVVYRIPIVTCVLGGVIVSTDQQAPILEDGSEYVPINPIDCDPSSFPDAEPITMCDDGTGQSFTQFVTVISSSQVVIVDVLPDGTTPYVPVGPVSIGACSIPQPEPDVEACGTKCTIGFDGRFINSAGGFAGVVGVGAFPAPVNGGQALVDALADLGIEASYLGFVSSDIQLVEIYAEVNSVYLDNGTRIAPVCEDRNALLVKICNDKPDDVEECVTTVGPAVVSIPAGGTRTLLAGQRYTIFVTEEGFTLDGAPIPCGTVLHLPECCGCTLDADITIGNTSDEPVDVTVIAEAQTTQMITAESLSVKQAASAELVRTKAFVKKQKEVVVEREEQA